MTINGNNEKQKKTQVQIFHKLKLNKIPIINSPKATNNTKEEVCYTNIRLNELDARCKRQY